MGFLSNLVKVFPSLATRPMHLTGESYAGTYIVSTYNPAVLGKCDRLYTGLALHYENVLWHGEPACAYRQVRYWRRHGRVRSRV